MSTMKTAILLCENFARVRAEFPEIPPYAQTFVDMLESASGAECAGTIEVFDVKNGELPARAADFDKYIITGSLASAYERTEWIVRLKKFAVAAAKKDAKLVGICFGHQLLAEAFGGKAERSPKGWGVGRRVSELKDGALKKYFPARKFVLEYSHHDQVVVPPKNAAVLSGSDFCPVESMRIGDFALTFQGHPEFTPEYSNALFKFFENSFSESEKAAYFDNASLPSDSFAVARAIADF